MQIDFFAKILDAKGKDIPVEGDSESPTTLGTLAESALLAQYPDEAGMSSADKVKRYRLFNKISGGDHNLTADEVTLLKAVIGKGYGPLAVGRAFDIIEAAELARGNGAADATPSPEPPRTGVRRT